MKTVNVDHEKCTACKLCELHCSFEKTGSFNPGSSRIKVEVMEEEFFFLPVICQQCDEPYCAEICPSQAIKVNPETGATEIDYALCIGCRICLTVCPFGGIDYSGAEGKVVKCDLCAGEPACVKGCPWEALEYGEPGQVANNKRKLVASKMKDIMKEVG